MGRQPRLLPAATLLLAALVALAAAQEAQPDVEGLLGRLQPSTSVTTGEELLGALNSTASSPVDEMITLLGAARLPCARWGSLGRRHHSRPAETAPPPPPPLRAPASTPWHSPHASGLPFPPYRR